LKKYSTSSKPKIAFLDLLFHWPPLGGSWVDVKEIASQLQTVGCDVKLFAPLFKDYFPRGSIKIPPPFPVELIPFNRFSFNVSQVQKRFKKAVDNYSPDIVFITDGYFLKPYLVETFKKYPVFLRFYAYEVLCPLNNFTRWGTVVSCENNFLKDRRECLSCFGKNKRYLKDAFNFTFARGDKISLHFFQEFVFSKAFFPGYVNMVKSALKEANVIVYNQYIADILSAFEPHIIPSGINTSLFEPSKRETSLLSKPVLNISMVGRVNDPVKGFHILDRAMRLISLHRDDFHLVITNEFDMPVQSYVRPVGWVSPSVLPKLYKDIDICVIPSIWHEPFGIGALEAMASGKPLIASRVGGLQDIVEDGVTGFLVEPRDVGELAEKLEILMNDSALRERMGKAGREKAMKNYQWKNVVKNKYIPLFDLDI